MSDFEQAKRDPKVIALNESAKDYAQKLIANGHCACHLVVKRYCPNEQMDLPERSSHEY